MRVRDETLTGLEAKTREERPASSPVLEGLETGFACSMWTKYFVE